MAASKSITVYWRGN